MWFAIVGLAVMCVILLVFAVQTLKGQQEYIKRVSDLENCFAGAKKDRDFWCREAQEAQENYERELENNKTILSQKKSSETRMGQMTENIVPFLEAFPYDPKNAHFLGQPIDFVVFDYDDGKIVFVEVKTGNAKESPRQKLIKNIIKTGRVYYEHIRVSPKGVKVKETKNNE